MSKNTESTTNTLEIDVAELIKKRLETNPEKGFLELCAELVNGVTC